MVGKKSRRGADRDVVTNFPFPLALCLALDVHDIVPRGFITLSSHGLPSTSMMSLNTIMISESLLHHTNAPSPPLLEPIPHVPHHSRYLFDTVCSAHLPISVLYTSDGFPFTPAGAIGLAHISFGKHCLE